MERQEIINQLEFHRDYVIDGDTSYSIKQEHWVAIDGLLDQLNGVGDGTT